MANGNKISVYALVSIYNQNDIKYVGITRRNPKYRLNSHLFEAKKTPDKNKRTKWISSLDFKITQLILDIVDEDTCDFDLLEKIKIALS
jgi:hypothetical protein